ncbi:MAG: hypothetical protein Q7R41_07715, partial [Phycisphaerales bacterium]|nr:hypothetical protein [Phycisphaerales bacterium]
MSTTFVSFEYAPAPPPAPPAPLLLPPVCPPPPPTPPPAAPMTSMVFELLFQSDGTVQLVPEVMKTTLLEPVVPLVEPPPP